MGQCKILSFLHPAASLFRKAFQITTTSRRLSTAALSREPAISEDVLTILETVSDIEAPLNYLAPLLSRHIVTAVLEETRSVGSGLRFFNWVATQKQLCSWDSHYLMISMIRGDPEFESAWELLAELRRSGVLIVPRVFQVLISAYSNLGMTNKALESFERMGEFDCRSNTSTFNTIMQILMAEGLDALAMAVYNRMVKSDCPLNRSTYNILINGLCKVGKIDDALVLFDEMFKQGMTPNLITYTVVLLAHCRGNRVEDVVTLLKSMKHRGLKPDLVAYNALLDGFCKMGRVDKAFELLGDIKNEFVPVLTTYSSLIDGLFRARKFEEACQLYKDMKEKDVKPDRILYTVMIRGYAEVGKVKEALLLLNEMIDGGIVPDTFCYNTLIKGLCDKGLLRSARSLVLYSLRNGIVPDSATYTILIQGLCKKGLVEEAQRIFHYLGCYGIHPNIVTFNVLMDGLCKAGQMKDACNLLLSMETGSRPYLYLKLYQGSNLPSYRSSVPDLVEQFCQSGNLAKAYMFLRELGNCGPAPDVVTYNILLDGFCKKGDMNAAYNLFMELQRRGYSPDEVTYGTLIGGFVRDKKNEFAFRIIDEMIASRCRPTLLIYTTLMTGLCRMGRVSEAVTFWLNHVSHLEDDEAVMDARIHFAQDSIDEAVRSLIVMHLKHGSQAYLLYTIWVHGFCRVRKPIEAFRIFSVLTEYNIDITPPCGVKLICSLCRHRRLHLAVKVILYTIRKGYKLRIRVGKHLLKLLCYQENNRITLGLASRMIQAGYDLNVCFLRTLKSSCMQP